MITKRDVQLSLLADYEPILWVLIFGLGGTCLKRQFDRFADKEQIEKCLAAGLLRKQKLGRNVIYLASKPVFQYFELENGATRYSSKKLLKQSLLAEMYYSLYCNDMSKIKNAILKSNMIYFTPTAHIDFMEDVMRLLEYNGIDSSLLKWDTDRLLKRTEDMSNQRIRNPKPYRIHKIEDREDLFTLAAKNIYISDARFDKSKRTLHLNIKILDVSNFDNRKLADRIALACRQ